MRHAAELVYRDQELERLRCPVGATLFSGGDPGHPRCPGSADSQLFADGCLVRAAGLNLEAATGRIMVCGNPDLAWELRAWLTARGLHQPPRPSWDHGLREILVGGGAAALPIFARLYHNLTFGPVASSRGDVCGRLNAPLPQVPALWTPASLPVPAARRVNGQTRVY